MEHYQRWYHFLKIETIVTAVRHKELLDLFGGIGIDVDSLVKVQSDLLTKVDIIEHCQEQSNNQIKKMEIEVTQAKDIAKDANSKAQQTLENCTKHKQQIEKHIEEIKNLVKTSSSMLTI